VVARFFDADTLPVELGSIEGWIFEHKKLDPSLVFVMIPQEYDMMVKSQKFSDIRVDKILPFPDGSPGFYFVHLRYVANIDEILAAEKQARKALVQNVVTIDGQQVKVQYSTLDMGGILNVFDGRENTNLRSLEANPLVIELDFTSPRQMSGLTARVGGVPTQVRVTLQVEGAEQEFPAEQEPARGPSGTPLVFEQQVPNTPLPRDVAVDFKATYQVRRLRLEVRSINDAEPAHIHLWEVTFR
jgi:hypothetical protein